MSLAYRVKRSISSAGPFVVIADGLATKTFVDVGATNGVGYFYQIFAVEDGIESVASEIVFARPFDPDPPFSNLEYLYQHLPAMMRRADAEQGHFLKRFLAWFGAELDKFDAIIDTLHLKVAPESATEEFINYFLWALFGWGWFPDWFGAAQKRAFYSDVAQHYARRGTRTGIEKLLSAFGVHNRVTARPQSWGEWAWGDDLFHIASPLAVVVTVYPQGAALQGDQAAWGDFTWGLSLWAPPPRTLTRVDYDSLLRFEQPFGHVFFVEEKIVS